jgi:hypothetical protein
MKNTWITGKQYTRFGVVYLLCEYIQMDGWVAPRYTAFKQPVSICGLFRMHPDKRKRVLNAIRKYNQK